MILIVDDDPLLRTVTSRVLTHSGFEATAVEGAAEALQLVEAKEPDLILCDVMMPGADGFEFRKQYLSRYPQRQTPFVYLTAREDPEFQVESLESGVDDYLVKPVSPAVLVARVKRYLARSRREATSFQGNLAEFDFIRLLQFCERQGLNGHVEVKASDLVARVNFQKGVVEPLDDATLDRLLAAKEGTFSIRPAAIDFSELPKTNHESPRGRLSSLALPGGLVDIETSIREGRIESRVTLNGKVLQRKTFPLVAGLSAEAENARVASAHADTEATVRHQLTAFSSTHASDLAVDKFSRHYEEGFTHFAARRYDEAIKAWEAAQELQPTHGSLKVNLEVARRRLAASRK